MKREKSEKGRETQAFQESGLEAYEERRKKVQRFNLTSDVFFGKVLEDKNTCQEVIRILLDNPDIRVKQVKAQYAIRNLENHSVVLDILAENSDGKLVNIEMQVTDDDHHQKRVRYYQASIDMSYLEKGVPYDKIPDIYLIYITERDFFNQNCGIYYIDRTIRNHGKVIDNGIHEIYANLMNKCGNERIDELLAYFKNSVSDYQTEAFPHLVEKVKFFKEKKEGVEFMCKILEEERNEGRDEGRSEGLAEGAKAEAGRYSQLIIRLAETGRQDDIIKAASDMEVLQELYREFEL